MKSILFICTGNTCRSPIAAGLFQKLLKDQKDIEVFSAGLNALSGASASRFALELLREEDVDISLHESRLITEKIVDRATHIFVMTHEHKRLMLLFYPSSKEKIFLLRESEPNSPDVPDPFGQSRETYQKCKNIIKNAVQHIFSFIQNSASLLPIPYSHGNDLAPLENVDLEESYFTNEYAEWYSDQPWDERDESCEFADAVEALAIERAKLKV